MTAPSKTRASAGPETSPGSGIGYLPGIDGLRAISVVAVLAYHLDATWAVGGYLGVEVFFVVSGFLITTLMLAEHGESGRLDRRAFWVRRARRLLPAVIALIVGVAVWAAVALPDGDLRSFRGDILASLAYVQNWHAIFADQPYFEVFGRPSPLRHLWSLAIEEQFYLLWPLVLPALLRLGRRRASIVISVLAAGSVGLMFATADVASPERAYYGTDTRLFGILAGAVLAFAWRPDRGRTISPGARTVVDVGGAVALAALAWQFANRSEFDPWTFPWGFVTVDALTLVAIVAVTHAGGRLRLLVGSGALAAVGRRSYSIYLWHWPVIVFTRPGQDWGLTGTSALLARLALIAALSEASYRFVEQPVRDGRAAAWLRGELELTIRVPRLGLLAAVGVLFSLGVGAVVLSAPSEDRTVVAADADPGEFRIGPAAGDAGVTRAPLDSSTTAAAPAAQAAAPTTGATAPAPPPPPPAAPAPPPPPPPAEPAPAPPPGDPAAATAASSTTTVPPPATTTPRPVPDITLIGESVMLGGARTIQEHYGDRVQIDAVEGRSFEDSVALVEWLASVDRLTPTVVLHIGNNGIAPAGALDRVVAAVGYERRLVLMNVRVPRRWESQVNDEIARYVDYYDHVLLADWNGLTHAEEGLLIEDGVHLSAHGKVRYRDLIVGVAP